MSGFTRHWSVRPPVGRSGNRPVVVDSAVAGCLAGCLVLFTASCSRPRPPACQPPGCAVRWPSRTARVRYQPPVAAPVDRPVPGRRPPPSGPATAGLEYATAPGHPVVAAAADGLVAFAGTGGRCRSTSRCGHADGIAYELFVPGGDAGPGRPGGAARTTHRRGRQPVARRARRGDVYLDPASLWGGPSAPVDVYLVPLDGYGAAPTGWIDVGGADGAALRLVVADAVDQPLGARLARAVRLVAAELDRMAASAERR